MMNSRSTQEASASGIRIHRAEELSGSQRVAMELSEQLERVIGEFRKSNSCISIELEVDNMNPFLCSPSMLSLFAKELAYILTTISANSSVYVFAGNQFGKNEIEIAFESNQVQSELTVPAFSRRSEPIISPQLDSTIQRHLIRCPDAGYVQVLCEDATMRLARTA